MDRNAQIDLTHRAIVYLKKQFFRLRTDIRSGIWSFIMIAIGVELDETGKPLPII